MLRCWWPVCSWCTSPSGTVHSRSDVSRDVSSDASLYGLFAWGILLASVIVHELGHVLAAWRLGGTTDLIVLGPLGGFHAPHVPREPHREVAVALAGPLASFVVMTILGPPLLFNSVNLGDILLDPLSPSGVLNRRTRNCRREIGFLVELGVSFGKSLACRSDGWRPAHCAVFFGR